MTKIVCIRRPLRRVGLLLGRRRQLHRLAQEIRHVIAEGDHGRVVLALARLRLALMTAVAAMIGRRARLWARVRPRCRSRIGRRGLADDWLGLRLRARLFARAPFWPGMVAMTL